MTFPWREQPASLLEQHFNPRVAVPHFPGGPRPVRRSLGGRPTPPGGLRPALWHPTAANSDLHRAVSSLSAPPLVLFLHGGYWRALDERDHSFVASLFVEAGVPLVNINYDLCPSVTLDEIVDEIREAVLYCAHHAADFGAAARCLCLVGHWRVPISSPGCSPRTGPRRASRPTRSRARRTQRLSGNLSAPLCNNQAASVR